MKIYDIAGAEVASLVNDNQVAGQYEIMFDGAYMKTRTTKNRFGKI